jgi:hypothetical protein
MKKAHLSPEIFDLFLTQAIERYADMNFEKASRAIAKEWPEQTAVLLTVFMSYNYCSSFNDGPRFVELERINGKSYYYSLRFMMVIP